MQYGHWVTWETATAINCFVFSERAPSLKTALLKFLNASVASGANEALFSDSSLVAGGYSVFSGIILYLNDFIRLYFL